MQMMNLKLTDINPMNFNLQSFVAMLVLIFSLAGSAEVFAQGGTTLTVRVTDEQGARVPGAEVRLRSREGVRLFARANDEGVYTFAGLAAGDYILEVTAEGFAAFTSESLRVERGGTPALDVRLSVKALNENVVVVAAGTPQRADEVSKSVTLL